MFGGLRTQILSLALIPPMVISIILGIYMSYSRIQEMQAFNDARAKAIIHQMDISAKYALNSGNLLLLQQLSNAALEESGVRAISIYDANKQQIIHSGPAISNLLTTSHFKNNETSTMNNNNIISFISPFKKQSFISEVQESSHSENSDNMLGWIVIDFSQDIYTINKYETYVTQYTLLALALLLSLYIGARLGQRLITDIREINNNIKRIKEGDEVTNIHTSSSAEMRHLANNIEDMANTLKNEFDELRHNVELTTSDLKETIETIEIQNIELNLAKKEALTASKIKSEFLANTSHEIRTPLNGIIGFTKILKKTTLSKQQSEHLETIQQSSENLLSIINDILDFSKIEAGKLELEAAHFNFRQILEETVSLFAHSAYEKNIEIVLLIYKDVPLNLIGDSLRIKQIVSNLLNNAVKFTNKGTISIRVSLESIEDDCAHLSVSVNDTGIGMTSSQQKNLFQAFTQANSSITREYGGTGLGLAIVKKLVNLMHGEIKVESTPNEGSTFTFTLKSKLADFKDTQSPQYLSGKSFLLIEKHALLNLQIKHTLENWGVFVLSTSSIDEAKALLEDHHIDAIIYGINSKETINIQLAEANNLANSYRSHLLLLSPTIFEEHLKNFNSNTMTLLFKPIMEYRLYNALYDITYPKNSSANVILEKPQYLFSNLHALVVDDNPANLKLLYSLLSDLGLTISQAINGQEAVALAKENAFDIIFMDIQMPVMNGINATIKIRETLNINQQKPIIAVTAHAMADEKNTLLESGMNDYLTKPINEEQLISTIKKWCLNGGSKDNSTMIVDVQKCLKLANNKTILAIDMFNMLLENLSADINAISLAFTNNDLTTLLTLVHTLHGACSYTGVPNLKNATKNFEQALKTEHTEHYEHLYTELMATAHELIEWRKLNEITKLIIS